MTNHLKGALRACLFVPANNISRVQKALTLPCDAVILDLEDAVAQSQKEQARACISSISLEASDAQVFVRVNALSTPHAFRDLEAAVTAQVSGVMLPMVQTARDIEIADWLLSQFEREAGMETGTMSVIALVETAKGIRHSAEIAAVSPRVRCLAFGAADFTLETGMHWSRGEAELMTARLQLVLASAEAGIEAPIDAVWVEISDGEGMTASAQRAKDHGFQGKMCIHPNQVKQVQAAYVPSEGELVFARRVVEAFDAAEASGSAAIQLDGKMIDYPVVERARKLFQQFG